MGFPGPDQSVKLRLSAPLSVGRPMTTGMLVLRNRGDRKVTLERAWPDEIEPGLKVLGVYVRPYPDRRGLIGLMPGFEPGSGRPPSGFVVDPQGEVTLFIGATVSTLGKHAFRGVALTYTDGLRTYKEVYPLALRLCAPRKQYINTCETPSVGS